MRRRNVPAAVLKVNNGQVIRRRVSVLLSACLSGWSLSAGALYISSDIEVLRIPDVGAGWQSIGTQNTYTTPVVVCVYRLPLAADNEAVVRLDQVASGGFDVRIQRPRDSAAVTPSDVHCLVAEEGLHTLPDGRQFEAHRVVSDGTNSASGWGVGGANGAENVSSAVLGTYPPSSRPAVLGQVMTYNDSDFSVFWSFDCDNRANPPFHANIADGICVGKQTGQDPTTRSAETLGYLIVEEGATPNGSFGGINYRVDLGANTVAGVGNSPPYTYALGASYQFAVATKEAENGGQGGWAQLYGADPLAGNALDLGIDEETVAGDTTRSHLPEEVAYWVFRGVDHGDAPSSYGDASHVVDGLLSIGTVAAGDADAEAAQFSSDADADDTGQLDDEEGVAFRAASGHTAVADVSVVNNTGSSVTLCAWLDVPSGGAVDGVFDASDGQCQVVGAASAVVSFQWSGLPTDMVYSTFARFRVSSSALTASDATGAVANGEVEDYPLSFDFTPTSVVIDQVMLEGVSVDSLMSRPEEYQSLLSFYVDKAMREAGNDFAAFSDLLTQLIDPDGDGLVAVFSWSTLEERGTVGFQVDRREKHPGEASASEWRHVGPDGHILPPLLLAPLGAEYLLLDPGALSGVDYEYRLVELEAWGSVRRYGPFPLRMEVSTTGRLHSGLAVE